MGLCTSKKSIEEIIHSKYTFAKDSTQKSHTKQFQHVYIWRYSADDLEQKQVRFYDSENGDFGMIQSTKGNRMDCEEQNKGLEKQYLFGKPVEWPIRCHADQAYIVLTVKNFRKELQVLATSNSKINQHLSLKNSCIEHFVNLQIPLEISQILHMIKLDSFRSYYYTRIPQQIQDIEFSAQIQIIVGDLIQKIDCLKLVTIAYELEKYLQCGAQNVLKMFYNEFQHITYLVGNCYKGNCQQQQQNGLQKISNNDKKEAFVDGEIPIERIFSNQIGRIMKSESYNNEQQKLLQVNKLFIEFKKTLSKFNVLNNAFFRTFNLNHMEHSKLQNQNLQDRKKYNKVVLNSEISKRIQQLCINSSQVNTNEDKEKVNIFHVVQGKESVVDKPKEEQGDIMNTSSPFVCEITQIDGMRGGLEFGAYKVRHNVQKMKKQKQDSKDRNNIIIQQQGNIEDSILLPKQLQQLNTKPIYPITISQPQQYPCPHPQIMITSYSGSSQFSQLQQLNVSLVINMSPWQCYNYFIKDFEYDWFWVERMDWEEGEQVVENENRWRLNICCLVQNVVYRIESHIQQITRQQQNSLIANRKTQQFPKAVIFCAHNHLIYSGTIAVAYLMLSNSYRLPFDHAYASVRQSTCGKFVMPKVYEEQLREMECRVNQLSSVGNMNALNTKSASYRVYEVGLYTVKDNTLIVGRYVGEINSSNQLHILPNNTLKSYFLIPNNLTSIIIKSINILCEDDSLLVSDNISKLIKSMGLTLRFFYGKQQTTQQKKVYFNFVQQRLLLQLIRYEYINFHNRIFNVQKYRGEIDLIMSALKLLITSQPIEKSFRKPQPFEQHPISLVRDINLLKSTPSTQKSHRSQPFNSKQTLTFKYPIVRPIFQPKKKDNYYVMIKKFNQQDKEDKKMCCNVVFYKGQNWSGLQQDKERYFQKVVDKYLSDVEEERIWIQDEQSCADQSLFDRESILF